MNTGRTLTDESLEWTIADINQAISAMPDNPKIFEYLVLRGKCEEEIRMRETKRIFRRQRRENVHDPMAVPIRSRWRVRNTTTAQCALRDANWRLATIRLYGC